VPLNNRLLAARAKGILELPNTPGKIAGVDKIQSRFVAYFSRAY
jgi:hypothetical protein